MVYVFVPISSNLPQILHRALQQIYVDSEKKAVNIIPQQPQDHEKIIENPPGDLCLQDIRSPTTDEKSLHSDGPSSPSFKEEQQCNSYEELNESEIGLEEHDNLCEVYCGAHSEQHCSKRIMQVN